MGKIKNFKSQFGGSFQAKHESEYAHSPHWNGKKFVNHEEPKFNLTPTSFGGFIKNQLNNRSTKRPKNNLEITPFYPENWTKQLDTPKFIWYGHATLLLQLQGKNILIDPMFGEDTTPIAPVPSKRYSKNTLDLIDFLPKIDAIFFTHDHYDHLDFDSIQQLKYKSDTFIVALGVGRHLEAWGIPSENIQEMDWWETTYWENIQVTFTPTKHFSGRGLFDRAKSLWGGWVFQSNDHQIYWSGDGGYDSHFKEIGKKFKSFDWAFLECGQYNEVWPQVHMFPEESIQAGLDVNAKMHIPYHWGAFTLSSHPWKEPAERFTQTARHNNVDYCTPRLGDIIQMHEEPRNDHWFEILT